MRFHPTITFEEYRYTCQAIAATKSRSITKQSWKGFAALAIICLVAALFLQIADARLPALILLAGVAICWMFSKFLVRRSEDRCFRTLFDEEKEVLNNQVLTIDESGISCLMCNGQATSHHTWNAFIKRIDVSDAFIFLPSPNSFIRVPKQMLSMSELETVWRLSSAVPTAHGR